MANRISAWLIDGTMMISQRSGGAACSLGARFRRQGGRDYRVNRPRPKTAYRTTTDEFSSLLHRAFLRRSQHCVGLIGRVRAGWITINDPIDRRDYVGKQASRPFLSGRVSECGCPVIGGDPIFTIPLNRESPCPVRPKHYPYPPMQTPMAGSPIGDPFMQ